MAYVSIPNDLSKIKTKLAFNLTSRQLVCFGCGAAVGIPAFLLTRSATLGIILSLVAGGGLTAVLVGTLGKFLGWPPLEQYLLSSVVKGVYTPQSGITQVWTVLTCTVAWAVIYGAGSLLAMEKRDI